MSAGVEVRSSHHPVSIETLDSGYLHIRGEGPCNWAQVPPHFSGSMEDLRPYAFPEASDEFLRAAADALDEIPA